MTRRDAGDKPLPTGYRIAEHGVPGVPPKYQVLHGAGRNEQFICIRDTRDEAEQLAHHHRSRIDAERAAQARTPGQRPPAPRR
jgi:hypothetical protein